MEGPATVAEKNLKQSSLHALIPLGQAAKVPVAHGQMKHEGRDLLALFPFFLMGSLCVYLEGKGLGP